MSVENIDNENNDPSIVDNDHHSVNNLLVAKNQIVKGNLFSNLPSTLEERTTFDLLCSDMTHVYVRFISTMQRAIPIEDYNHINRRWKFGDERIRQGCKIHKFSQITPSLLDAMFGDNFSLLERFELIKSTDYQTTIHIASAKRLTSLFCMGQDFYPTGPSVYIDKYDYKHMLCGKVYFYNLDDNGSVTSSETFGYIINDYISNHSKKITVILSGTN